MKKISLELNQFDMFSIAWYLLGRFHSEDSTPEERIAYLDNIHILKQNMDEFHNEKFSIIYKEFESKLDNNIDKK